MNATEKLALPMFRLTAPNSATSPTSRIVRTALNSFGDTFNAVLTILLVGLVAELDRENGVEQLRRYVPPTVIPSRQAQRHGRRNDCGDHVQCDGTPHVRCWHENLFKSEEGGPKVSSPTRVQVRQKSAEKHAKHECE